MTEKNDSKWASLATAPILGQPPRSGAIVAGFSDSNDEKAIRKLDAGKRYVQFDEGEQTSGILLVCFLLYGPRQLLFVLLYLLGSMQRSW